MKGQDRRREKSRILRRVQSDRRHWDTGGHLYDGEETIQTEPAVQRNTDHGLERAGGDGARKRGGESRHGDEDIDRRIGDESIDLLRIPMRGRHMDLAGNVKLGQSGPHLLGDFEVGFAPNQDHDLHGVPRTVVP